VSNLYSENREAARVLAKEDYFTFEEPMVISEKYGIPHDTLYNWMNKPNSHTGEAPWKELRGISYDKLFDKILNSEECSNRIRHILGYASENLKRGLLALTTRETPLSLSEMSKLSLIMKEVNTMLRLEKGEATEIFGRIDTSPQGIKTLVDDLKEIDPYVDYEEDIH
jgi:hypothetical protein